MKVLVIGSGGREHALAWRLARDGHRRGREQRERSEREEPRDVEVEPVRQHQLEADQERDWTLDLGEDARRFEATLRQKFPELDPIVARSLANCWSFGWR